MAVALAHGPAAGLEIVDKLADDPSLRLYHRLPSARGDLLFKLGRFAEGAGGVRTGGIADAERARECGSVA